MPLYVHRGSKFSSSNPTKFEFGEFFVFALEEVLLTGLWVVYVLNWSSALGFKNSERPKAARPLTAKVARRKQEVSRLVLRGTRRAKPLLFSPALAANVDTNFIGFPKRNRA
jgi:hypothetical protein